MQANCAKTCPSFKLMPDHLLLMSHQNEMQPWEFQKCLYVDTDKKKVEYSKMIVRQMKRITNQIGKLFLSSFHKLKLNELNKN